jgi:hypothetical protein
VGNVWRVGNGFGERAVRALNHKSLSIASRHSFKGKTLVRHDQFACGGDGAVFNHLATIGAMRTSFPAFTEYRLTNVLRT